MHEVEVGGIVGVMCLWWLAVVVTQWGSCASSWRGDLRGISHASGASHIGRDKVGHLEWKACP